MSKSLRHADPTLWLSANQSGHGRLPLTRVIEDQHAGRAAEDAKGLVVQLRPHLLTRLPDELALLLRHQR